MAREEADREDLMREATALVERIELRCPDDAEPVIAGFRSNGCLSLYFGQEVVYHFNSLGQLRRLFYQGLLYKAEQGRLASLNRQRTATAVELQRHDLTDQESFDLIEQVKADLRRLLANLRDHRTQVLGQVPEQANIIGRLIVWLEESDDLEVASSPHAR